MRFRRGPAELRTASEANPLALDRIRKVIGTVLEPAHFFIANGLVLEWVYCPSEEIAWEMHQGRLLDATHTRLRQTFESWNVFAIESGIRSAEPILSLKLDAAQRHLHVIRAILCYAWEGYHAGHNVYSSREIRKWIRERIETVDLDRFFHAEELRDELVCLLFQAVVGCSRLPLQSVEAPLPAFSLGGLGYFYRSAMDAGQPRQRSMQSFHDLIEEGLHADLAQSEKAKLLESVLRSTAPRDLDAAAELFLSRWHTMGHSTAEFLALCRTVLNEVSLSPYTDFIDRLLVFLISLTSRGELSTEAYADFLSYVLRQNSRHLTAYDLITFHHRGANYPDALLLDTVLKAYLALIETRPELFFPSDEDAAPRQEAKRRRRRALRQAWLLRRSYQGLLVPDAPTSPGENARVLPPPYQRVPEEQIFQPDRRTKRLFEGNPLLFPGDRSREVMEHCIDDLRYAEELQELGMAVFLDRPFGVLKPPLEPDKTLLLAYETFSRCVAERRLQDLAMDPAVNRSPALWKDDKQNLLAKVLVRGIPILKARKAHKPGAVTLQDAARVAEDFLVLRTTRQGVEDFLAQFDCTALAERFALDYLNAHTPVLIVGAASTRMGPEGIVEIYDARLRRRLELRIDPTQGYRSRAGHEYPAAGLRVLRAWDADDGEVDLREHDLEREALILPPRR